MVLAGPLRINGEKKGAFFLVCKVYWFLLYKFQTYQNFPAFQFFFSLLKKFSAFPKFGNFGQLKLKQSQLSSSFPSWKYLPKFANSLNFWCGPLQLMSNSQLQSQLKTTVKFWKSSKILAVTAIISLKNTTARGRNKIR